MEILDKTFRLEEINGDGVCPTYLFRWTLLVTRWFKVYLHHFVGDDWSKDLHDHPKRFVTIGLRGRYVEQTPYDDDSLRIKEREFKAPWVRSFPATYVHRLRLHPGEDCWTIAIVFKSVRQWGFWNNGNWIHWRKYVDSDLAELRKACE